MDDTHIQHIPVILDTLKNIFYSPLIYKVPQCLPLLTVFDFLLLQ